MRNPGLNVIVAFHAYIIGRSFREIQEIDFFELPLIVINSKHHLLKSQISFP